MATRREYGMGSVMRRAQRSENSSPYKRRAPEPKLQSSSSLSSFLSFLSNPFRRKSSASVPSPPPDSDQSEADTDVEDEEAPELGVKPRGRMVERENPAAETLSRLGQTLQQTLPKPLIPPSIFPSDSSAASEMKPSASTSQIAPIPRPRRSVQPSFATISRVGAKRPGRPTFPGGIASYGGFSTTAEPSPPLFTPSNPLETSFAANRPPASNSQFSFNAKPSIETHNVHRKTNSEVLAEFFAAKGKAPLTPEERKKVAKLIAESDAESSQSPDADPYNGVPSFSFLKASFPAPERDSLSPSNSLVGSVSAPSTSGLSFNFGSSSKDLKEPSNPTSSVAPRKRRPINYGGSTKRSAAITKAGFTLREHQKLLEKQKARQENVAPDSSAVGDKRGVRETEEDGGGKRRKANDGQASAVEETPKATNGVARVLSLSAQPSMPSPLRQMTKLNSPSPPRVVLRAQAPSPSSPLSRPSTDESPVSAKTPTAAKVKPRTSLVADVMRDMLAEDKAREKKEQAKEKPVDSSVFANPYEDVVHQPIVPKVRKPRRVSARPAAKSSATVAKQEEKPLSLIEKIEKTDVRPNTKKARTSPEPPAPQPPTFTFTAPSPREAKPKARRPPPVVEEPTIAPTESDEIEIIDMDEDPKSKPSNTSRLALSVDVLPKPQQNGNSMLGLPGRQRQSFSLHSPARPSPLREMSVPIEDEEDEIVELVSPDKGPFGSTSGFGSSGGFGSTNGFGSTTGFGSTGGFGSTSGFGSTTNGSSLHSFGFGSSAGTFSAPVPPPAPVLAPAQLPGAKKEALKVEAPLFTPKHEVPEPKFTKPEPPKPEVVAPKPVVPAPAPKLVVAPAPEPVIPVPAPAPAPQTESVFAPKPQTISPPAAPLSEQDVKSSAQSTPIPSLPVFSFAALVPSKPIETPESREAASVPLSKLPVFSFGSAPAPAKTASFDWGAAGMKAPSATAGAQWTCGTCSLSNPATAADKCTICDAPKPKTSAPTPTTAPAPVAKTASFDWGAAGMKAPTTGTATQWTCGTCSLSNPASATEKCTICEAPKPGASAPTPAPAPAPVTKTASFDWGAAGMKAPTTAGWTCGTCGLSNPATAHKCTVCDAAR